MKIYSEISLENFDAWSGGRDTLDILVEKGLCDTLEYHLENDIFSKGCTDAELNDYLWFERDFIAELIGFSDWEDLENDSKSDDDDEGIDTDAEGMELLDYCIGKELEFQTYCEKADCSVCPFCCRIKLQTDCEKAYNNMLDGYNFDEAIALLNGKSMKEE